MKRVYLIRHGLPDFPEGKRMCLGHTDLPLSLEGRWQAEQMAAGLPPVTSVFSSPLSRAVQTAQAIRPDVTVLEGLRELDAGDWDSLTFEQIRACYPELFAARANNPCLPLPNAEDEAAGLARFTAAMNAAAEKATGDFAVVAHGGVIGLFLQKLGLPRRKPAYTEVISLIWGNGQFHVLEEKSYA